MPELTASESGQTGTGNDSTPHRAVVRTKETAAPFTVTRPRGRTKAPTDDDDEPKSFTVDRYHFRKDGAGYECREVIGKGAARKRPYLAYLSRTALDEMRAESADDEQFAERVIKWAKAKKKAKGKS
jgi:hypothetical protein